MDTFEINDEVLVDNCVLLDDTQRDRLKKKWTFKFSGPYKITEKISPAAYRVELPANCRAHNVINAHFLRRYKRSDDNLFPHRNPVDPAIQPGSDQQTVTKIEAFKKVGRKDGDIAKYLTHWVEGQPTWTHWRDFCDFHDGTINSVFLDYLLSHPFHTVPKLTDYLRMHQEVDLLELQHASSQVVGPGDVSGPGPEHGGARRRPRRRRRRGG